MEPAAGGDLIADGVLHLLMGAGDAARFGEIALGS